MGRNHFLISLSFDSLSDKKEQKLKRKLIKLRCILTPLRGEGSEIINQSSANRKLYSTNMAIQSRSITTRTRDIQTDGKRQMNIDEFKQWLMTFDTNRDGRISKDELKKALRSVGGWYHAWRNTEKGLYADANGDGLIDDEEIYNLLDFAEQCMGVRIIAY